MEKIFAARVIFLDLRAFHVGKGIVFVRAKTASVAERKARQGLKEPGDVDFPHFRPFEEFDPQSLLRFCRGSHEKRIATEFLREQQDFNCLLVSR
jgi:hypothetical protein